MELSARTIDVPERLDARAIEGVLEALARAREDAGARVWILRGGAGVFCRGMDLAAARFASTDDLRRYALLLRELRAAPRPTIALVDGEALGGGLGLAAACDRAIATERASVGLPEALFGLIPAMVIPVLLERMRPHDVRALAISGRTRAAAWARERGCVDEVAPREAFDASLRSAVRELSRVEPRALLALREWVGRAGQLAVDEAIDEGASVLATRLGDPDTLRALRAFSEEGVAPWR